MQAGYPLQGDMAVVESILRSAALKPLLIALAGLAARHTRSPAATEAQMRNALLTAASLELRTVAQHLAMDPDTVLVNEGALLWLQGMALRVCPEDGGHVSDELTAFLLLGANDFCIEWPPDDEENVSRKVKLAGGLARGVRAMFFNRHPDLVRVAPRFIGMLEGSSRRLLCADDQAWIALQRAAFDGDTAAEYMEDLLFPLLASAISWGEPGRPPIIEPASHYAGTAISPARASMFLAALTQTTAEARDRAGKLGTSGALCSLGFRTPLLDLGDGRSVCLSPRLIDLQITDGLPARMRNATKGLPGRNADQAVQLWGQCFGKLTEEWIERLIADASACSSELRASSINLHLFKDNEITDFSFASVDHAVLIESKARTMAEPIVKSGISQRDVHKFFADLLFKSDGGALCQLDRAVRRVRTGEAEVVGIAKTARLSPVVVHYDALSLETPMAAMWVDHELGERHLLNQASVDAPTFMSLEVFEALLSAVAAGQGLFSLMTRWNADRARYEHRFSVFLSEMTRGATKRLPMLEAAFLKMGAATQAKLFPNEPA
jgi:hypothetical protein